MKEEARGGRTAAPEVSLAPPFECRALIFNLDGVLVDSLANAERHWRAWASRHGLAPEEVLPTIHGRRTVETVRKVAPHLNAEAEAEELNLRESEDASGVVPVEGAADLLALLSPNKFAIATSSSLRLASARLAEAGLPLPRTIVTADDVRRGKPDPEPYLAAARILGIEPGTCVVVEDAPVGIEAAKAAGMKVVAVETTHPAACLSAADARARRLADLVVEVLGKDGLGEARLRVCVGGGS